VQLLRVSLLDRLFENFDLPASDPARFRVEVLFSPGESVCAVSPLLYCTHRTLCGA
jgi:hypothetical protein